MPTAAMIILGLLSSALGLAGLWSQTMQVFINIHRDKSFSESGITPILLSLMLLGGLFMLALAVKKF